MIGDDVCVHLHESLNVAGSYNYSVTTTNEATKTEVPDGSSLSLIYLALDEVENRENRTISCRLIKSNQLVLISDLCNPILLRLYSDQLPRKSQKRYIIHFAFAEVVDDSV